MWPYFESQDWLQGLDQLASNDYVVFDHFLPEERAAELLRLFMEFNAEGELQAAKIGSFDEEKRRDSIRTDWIRWLYRTQDMRLEWFFEGLDAFRAALSRDLFITLQGYEFHFALYPKGAFYRAHYDQFQHRDNRTLSFVLYLNEGWVKGDGGELKIHTPHEYLVEPVFNRLVLFRSDTVLHEVLPARKPRRSLTGWLLKQPSDVGILGI